MILEINSQFVNLPFDMWFPIVFPLSILTLYSILCLFTSVTSRILWLLLLMLVFGVLVVFFNTVSSIGFYTVNIGGAGFRFTPQTFFFCVVILVLFFIIFTVLCVCNVKLEREEFVLLGFLVIFSVLTFLMVNFISIFVLLELISVILYIFASLHNDLSTDASLKYALFSILSSCLLLVSLLIIYIDVGTLLVCEWRYCNFSHFGVVGLVLCANSFLFKIGCFPYHNWSIDVYIRSTDFALAIFSNFTKLFLLGVFINIFSFIRIDLYVLHSIFLIFGFGCFHVGIIGAITSSKIKNFITYSGLVSLGYFMVGYSLCGTGYELIPYLYLVSYSVTNCLFFFILFSVTSATSTKNLFVTPWLRKLQDFTGLFFIDPFMGFIVIICFFSFMGLPPFIGFIGKLLIISTIYSNGFMILSAIILLISIISSFYYLRLIKYLHTFDDSLYIAGNKLSLTVYQRFIFICFVLLNILPIFCYELVINFIILFF